MPIFDYLKKTFPKKVKEEAVDEALASKDKEQISQLVEKEVTVDQQRLDLFEQKMKIEKEITAIQRSTRVSMPIFASLHNTLRMKYQWYYKWHMAPFSSLVHWLTLSSFSTIFVAVVLTALFTNTVVQTFADSRHSWDTKEAWSTWDLSNVVADESNSLSLAPETPTTSGETAVSGESAIGSGATTEETLVADYMPTGTATLVFTPWKKEVVDWLAAESKETLNGGLIKKEYSTDNILFTEDIANLADSETIYIRLTFSTTDPKISPVLASLAINYSRLPYAPEGVSFESKQVLFTTSQILTAGAFIDPDNDDHAASQWQITTQSGDYTASVLDQTVTSSDTSDLTSLTLKNSLDAGNYFARVRYKDSKGAWSLWSQEVSFTVVKPEGQKTSVQNNGTGQVAANPNEILADRTETTKTIDNKNGTKTLESYAGIVHYKEDYSKAGSPWLDINADHSVDTPDYVLFDQMPSTVKVFKDKIGYEIESRITGDKYTVILKDVDGTPAISRSKGTGDLVAWADINTPDVTLRKQQNALFSKYLNADALAEDAQVTQDNGNLKFEFQISESGVRLWKTIKGDDAPKNFQWDITKTEGTKAGTVVTTDSETKVATTTTVKDDLKFRDKPEAFDVTPTTGEIVKDSSGQDKVVPVEAKKIEGDLNSTFVWQETAPKSDMKIDTDVIYYPNADPETRSVDGEVGRSWGNSTWSEITTAAGNSSSDSNNYYLFTMSSTNQTPGNWDYLGRSIFLFNTSSIPNDATISGATFSVYGTGKGNYLGASPAPDVNVYSSSPASNTELTGTDYGSIGSTPFSTPISYDSYAAGVYNDFLLNSSGLAAIDKSGVSKLGVRNANYDVAGIAPNFVLNSGASISAYFAESGASTAPKLSVTYTGGNTVSGTIYLDDTKTSNVGSGVAVGITSNGGDKMTTTTGAGGTFSFTGVEVVANKPITVFEDSGSWTNLVTMAASATNITGLELYQYKTVVRHESGISAITNADLAIANDCNCIPSGGSAFSVINSKLTIYDLFVPTGIVFTPGGDVDAAHMTNYGTIDMESHNFVQTGSDSLYFKGGTFNAGSGTHVLVSPTFSGGTFNGDSSTITLLNASFTMSGGIFNATSGNMTLMTDSNGYYNSYTWNISGGTFNHNNGTFTIGSIPNNYNNTPYTFSNLPTFYNLVHANTGGGNISYGAGLTVANDLTVTNGYFSPNVAVVVGRDVAVSSGAYFSGSDITIGRNLTTAAGGTFSPYYVTFNTAQTSVISGDNNPYNFTCATAGKTLSFAANSTQTISYALTIQGSAGNNVVMKLNGTAGSGQWKINANTSGYNPWTVDYVTYSDSNNLNVRPIAPTNSTASGSNNTNWTGSHVSGTAYTDLGKSYPATNTPVSISVNGGAKQTVNTDGSGAFDFVVGGVTANLPITIFYEDGSNYYSGNLVTVSAGSGDITGLELYTYMVSLTYENSGPMTNTILATADNCPDANGKILFSVDGSNVLSNNYSLHIPASKVYTPGASVSTYGAYIYGTINASSTFTSSDMGNFYVESGAVFNAGTGTVTIGGLYLNGGTFNSNSSTLVLNGYSTYISGGTFNSNTATVTIKSYNFYLYGGTFNAPAGTLTLDANNVGTDFLFDISGGGTFVHNNGSIQIINVYSSNRYGIRTGSNHLYWLLVDSSAGTVATLDDLHIDYQLSISNSNNFDASSYGLETVNFVQTNGSFSAPYGTMKVSGSFNNSGGSFSHNGGTVELNGGAGTTQTVTGSTTFYNFTMTATSARTINFNAGTNQTVQGWWTATGTAGNQLILARSGTGQWEITPSTSMGNQWTVDYVSVSNSKNDASAPILPANWTKGVNVTNWDAVQGCVWDGGGSDNNWSTAANWTLDAVPTAACDVVFDSTSTKASTLDSGFTAHVKSLSINSGYTNTLTLGRDLNDDGALNLGAGTLSAGNYTLNVGGSWSNTGGTFSKGTSTVNFNGSVAATLASNSNDFYNVTIAGGGSSSSDDFNSGTISSDRWTTSGTVSNVSNKAQFTVSSYNGASYITAKNALSGDYDIQYDYDLSSMSTPNINYAGMYLISDGVQLAVVKNSSASCYYYTYDGTQYTDATNDCSGKLRVVRSGSNLTTYRWVSSSSSWAVSKALTGKSTADTSPQIMMYNPSYVTTVATVDNYLINSGTVVGGGAAGAYTLSSALTASNNLTMTSGTFASSANAVTIGTFTQNGGTFTAPSTNMYVSGDFAHTSGTFTHNSGIVNLNGGDSSTQNISGTTTFNNLTIPAGASTTRTVKFAAGTTQTVAGTTTVSGAVGKVISLNSSSDGSQWSIDPQGARAISYASVKDSINANATAIYTNNSGTNVTNAGNDVNWFASSPPTAPSNVVIGSIDSTLFTVTWTDNSSDETGFKVYTAAGNADCSAASYSGTPDFTTAANAVSQAITGKSINTQYCAKVIATNASGDSAPAYAAPKYTLANVPSAPTATAHDWDVTTGNNPLSVVINVNSNPASTQFAISCNAVPDSWLQGDGNCSGTGKVWKTKANWETGIVNYAMALANVTVNFKVIARNGDNTETSASSAGTATSAPAQPTGLTHIANTTSQISWDWADVTGATSYRLYKSADDSLVGSPSSSNYDQGSLSTNTQYTNYVRAYNGVLGQPSATASAYTSIEAASGITFGTITSSSIQVSATGSFSNLSSGSSGLYITKSGGSGTGFASWNTNNNTLTNSGLSANTQYSYTAQTRNGDGETTTATGSISQYTLVDAPTVTTSAVSSIGVNTATGNGTITNTGGENASVRGFAYAVDSSVGHDCSSLGSSSTSYDSVGNYGTGAYTKGISSLTANIYYCARAYATNSAGTGNGAWVSFKTLASYTLTYSAGANGSIVGTTPQTVNYGANGSQVTATPASHYHFVKWSDNNSTNPVRTDTNVTADITTTASFAIDTFTLTYSAGSGGSVVGTSPQTVNYNASGSQVTATPTTGYHFVKWSDNNSTNPARTDTNVTADITTTASFAIDTFTLTYSAGSNGSVVGTSPQTINYGASGSQVSATPAAHYHFVKWSDNNSTVASRTDTNVTADITTTASFAIDQNIITVTAGSGGITDKTGDNAVNYGGSLAVAISPNAHYYISGISLGGVTQTISNSAGETFTITNVTASTTLAVTFAINTYTLTYSAGANGSIVGTTPQTVNYGANGSQITATPAANYHFVKWSDNNSTNPVRTDTNVTGNITTTASFAINTFTLTYSAGINGSISGTSPQSVNYGADGSQVTAVPAANYHFVKWSDNNSTNPTRTDTNISADITTTASFAIDTFTLTYNAGSNGTVVGTSPQTVNYGANGSLVTATPAANYHFVKWSDNDSTVAARTDINVTADLTTSASFALDAPASPTGVTITPTSSTTFDVSWTDNSSIETGYKVYTAAGNSDCSAATYSGTPDITTAADVQVYGVSSKSVNFQYCAKVIATNTGGDSAAAYAAPKYTLANVPTFTTVAGDYSDTDKWHLDTTINASGNPAGTNYYIQYSTNDGTGSGTFYDPNVMAWQTSTSYLFKKDKNNADLTANTQYWMKVKAKNGDNVETIYTSNSVADVTPPAAPSISAPSNITASSALISWSAAAGADKYTVSYGTDSAATNKGTITDIAGTSKSFADLNQLTKYYFKVQAISNANGTGPFSDPANSNANFTTGDSNAPVAPVDFAGAASINSINWTWSDSSATEQGYRVENTSETNLSGDLAANTTSWNEISLSPDTAYTRHVDIWNASGSNDSNVATVYTLANTPSAPTVSTVSSSKLKIVINQNGNSSTTRYAIYNSTASKYVKQADHTLQDSPDWQLYTDWGGASGIENWSLTKNTSYSYTVKAMNGDSVQTGSSVAGSATTLNNFQITVSKAGNGAGDLNQVTQTLDAGSNLVTVATPAASSNFTSWTGCDSVITTSCTLSNITADKTITATFTLKAFTVTINKTGNGDGTFDQATQSVNYGSNLTTIATPAASSNFTSWTGCDSTNGTSCALTNITTNHTITATFTLKTYTVTVSKAGNGSGTLDQATQSVNYGSNLTTIATPAASSNFTSWTGCDSTNGTSCTLSNITADKTITATFTLKTFTVTINKTGNGDGTFDQATQSVNYGSNLTTVATPAASSNFTSWTGCDSTNGTSCTLSNITAGKTITGTFTLKTYTLSYMAGARGSILGTSPQTVDYGSSGSLVTATPDVNYHFISWSDGVLTAARTDANITADKSVTATFVSVVITPTSSTEFTVSWNNVPTAENGFEVYIALGAADCAIASYDSAANYTLAAGATSQSVTSYNMIPANFIDYNTQYCAKVVALTASGPSDPMFAQPKYTFAQTPTRPTVNTQTSDSLTVKINQTANPASTEFAVKVVKGASTRYLKTDGTLTTDSAPVWATYAAFGGDSGLVNAGLVFDADYIYSVAARNGEGIETDYSDINTIHPPVASTTCTWDGGGSDNSWSTPANWSDDVAPSATCDVVFNSTSAKDSIVNAGFTSHIKSFSVNTGYSGTISASNTLYDDGNFILNSGTFTANAQTLNIGGSLTIAAAPTAVFDKGTSTINLNPIDTGKTIRTNGQAIGILTFNGVDNVVDPNVKANNSLSLLANGTLVAGWTLQDSLSTTSIMVNAGTLVDGGKSVTVAGDIIIANKIGVLASTGLWTQSASGNIANPVMQNAFGSLTVAGEGVTTTLTNSIRVGICTGSAGKLTMGPGTLVGQGKALTVYPKTNDSLTVNNLTAGSRIGSLTIYPLAANLTQKAITLPDSFTTLVQIQQGITGILTATGNFDFGRSTCRFVKDNSYAPIGYVDMGSYNLHCNNLVLGNNAGGIYERIPGYLKLGSGTTTIDGNLSAGGSPNIGDKLDLGSGTLNIVGNFNSNYMTVVPGTSTVNLTGASGSTQTISGNTTFNNLSATSTSARTLRFAAGSTQTVLGTWTGTGAAGQLLMLGLKTGDTGSWNINPMGSRNISYVNVSNSRNTSPIIINPPNSLDSGSNDNWFPPVGTITFSSAKTNQKDQTLALTSYNGAQMKISNVADFAGADYETFSASKAWTLLDPTVDGTKTVYAKFKDIYGNESSTISASITLDMIPTAAPNNLTATAGNTSISLSWTNPKDVDFTTTVLYRSTKSDFVPTIGNNVGHYDEILNNKIANFAGDIQTYLDANVVNGITYYYKVRAIDNVDNYSVESNIASARADNDLPTTPTSLTLSNKTNTKDGMEYINVKDGILSFYPAIDLNSGINKYIISIGTASNSIDVLSSKELLVSSLGNQDKPSIAFSAISSSIAGLADGTYYIRVQAADNLGNLSSVSTELKFMIDTVAPVISGEVNATDVSNRSASLYKALLTWPEATETGSGLIGYVVKRGGEILAPDASLVTGNIQYDAVNKIYSYLDNLGASKSASYTISAVDFAKNESTSLNAKFNGTEAITVILPPEAPGEGTLIITEPKAAPSDSLGEKTMATITWKTSVPATSQILYGESTDYALKTEFDAGLNSFHTVVLKDLKFNTTYHYVVISKDRNGNEVRSDQIAEFKDLTFVTKDVLKDQAVLDTVIQNLSGSLMKVRDIIANMISQTSIVNTNQSIANSLGMKAENVPAATSTVAISVAAAAAAAAPIANAMTLFSLPEYLRALIYSMLSLGTKRKRKEWGRIVEDGTDLPIAQAKILLFKLEKTLNSTYVNKKLIETVYSDADGNYAFIAGPGEYEISVMKDMYYMAENNSKSYKPGSVITVKSEAEGLIVPTIHMSMTPDDTKKKLFSLKRLDNIERALVYISLAFLIFGTITVISGLAKNFTSVTNLILLAVYPFLWYLNIKSLKKSSPFGNVVDKQNSQGVPLSLVRVMSKDGRKLIKTTVTNQTGKFQTLVQKGQYQVKVAKTGYLQAEPAMLDTDRKIESLHERIEMDRDRRI